MTNEIDWDKAPEGAEFFNTDYMRFYKVDGESVLCFDEKAGKWHSSLGFYAEELKSHKNTIKRPKPKYEYGIEYPTNGQKPDLPDDVLVEFKDAEGRWDLGEYEIRDWFWSESSAFRIVDERYKPAETAQAELKPQNQYQRTIIGLDGSKCVVDVYRVLDAFKTDSPALDHAIKKILCPGTRHQKDREQDLKEAIKSIEAELLLMSQR